MPPKKGNRGRGGGGGGGRGRGRSSSKKAASPPPSPPSPISSSSSSESLPPTPTPPTQQSPEAALPPRSPPISQRSTSSSSSSRSTSQYMDPLHLSPSLPLNDLAKRLISVSSTFQSLKQQESPNDYFEYLPLCHHLTSDSFLNHPNRDIRLYVACCLADILRIYAPEPPFKDPDQLKSVFKFLISQLEGLKNPQDTSFSRYYYLLENLSLVKAFTICFDMDVEDAQSIFVALFNLIFSIISNDHSPKLKSVTLDLLEPIVSEDDHLSFDILDIILKHILEPVKSSRKMAYELAKHLIIKCSESLEVHVNSLLNHILISNKSEYEGISVSNRVYDLIYELHLICPSILQTVLPQLDYRLKSLDDTDRLNCVTLLAKMFASKDASLDSSIYIPLWNSFLGRFNDISTNIRLTCVKHSSFLLLNHPSTRKHVVECLSSRQLDQDENVRLEVVKQIVTCASPSSDGSLQHRLDGWKFVTGNEDLLKILKERSMDKKVKIRAAALQGLGQIYKQFLEEGECPPSWIHNKILVGYYVDSLEDRILIERLFNTCLVPFKMAVKERMMQFVYLFATLEPTAQKAFIEVQKSMLAARRYLLELLKVIQMPVVRKEDIPRLLNFRISALSKLLPDSIQAAEHINSLVNELKLKIPLSQALQVVCDSTADCQEVMENVNKALKSLGTSKSGYYLTIKTLLERSASLLIDNPLLLSLLQFTHSLLDSPSTEDLILLKNFPFPPDSPILLQKTCLLLSTLIFLFPLHIASPRVPPPPQTLPTLKSLISIILHPSLTEPSSSTLLSSLAHLGTICQSPLTATPSLKSLLQTLTTHCTTLLETGSPRQAKMSLRLLSSNHPPPAHSSLFSSILSDILTPSLETSSTSATSICALGHLSLLSTSTPSLTSSLKSLITSKLLRRSGLLLSPPRNLEDSTKNRDKSWVDRQSLPQVTFCMILALKAVTNWIITRKTDLDVASSFFRMLTMFIESGGGELEKMDPKLPPFSASEQSWLRLQAATCFLKLVRVKGVGDQFTAAQYCALGKLMIDPVDQVRFRFHSKLHKGLSRGFPDKCLPLDFLGFYCLAAFEPDRKQKQLLKKNLSSSVKVRRDWMKTLQRNVSEEKQMADMVGILPDYAVGYGVIVLTFLPQGNSEGDGGDEQEKHERLMERLSDARKGMMGLLDGVGVEKWSYGFFKKLIGGVKNRVNGVDSLDDGVNRRMWAVCDLVMDVIVQRCQLKGKGDMGGDYPGEVRVPRLYYKRKEVVGGGDWRNEESYLPEGWREGVGGRKRAGGSGGRETSMLKARNEKEGKGRKRGRVEEDGQGQGEIEEREESVPPRAKQSRVEGEVDGGSESSNVNAVAATPEVEEVEVEEENEENAQPSETTPLKEMPGKRGRSGGKRSLEGVKAVEGTRRSERGRGTTPKETRKEEREEDEDNEEDFIPPTQSSESSSSSSPLKKRGRGRPSKKNGGDGVEGMPTPTPPSPSPPPPPLPARRAPKPVTSKAKPPPPKMRLRRK